VLKLADHWVWDFWHCWSSGLHHLFYLKAPKALGDPDLRHWNVRIGHAVSHDLVSWEELADALGPGPPGTWDDYTTWTGSVIATDEGWTMLYTGTNRSEDGLVQRIGLARSDDLLTWNKHPEPVLEADPRWYELLDLDLWHDQAWRDPWVLWDEATERFHVFVTARRTDGPTRTRGVIGHATSTDLSSWQVLPPLDTPPEVGHMEIPQVLPLGDGRWGLLYSANDDDFAAAGPPQGGSFLLVSVGESITGPYRRPPAFQIVEAPWYGGRVIDHHGPVLLSWKGADAEGFAGIVGDPIPWQPFWRTA
jgi:beta-fructofuranosidase